ncbi:uncharacterized protein BP01DRAFT_164177 [Aspergillus saccharolyticus JOP 1030-1]|uniref:Uncharacterized protein n=1 Tax=Aspergillus saccharolyticus JOP 1030-1 TaxID=1450539 RepID=A0A318ZN24_9EURO|nr:hypothetical protein BP01DRAFT_164177 [Aspergillus saccharolyticus JOP 1030-1]PYH41568.1 hypothetical protein BP01DRAFT_164177 [Aspergillus saccharolyticus JOP 1030-1]
MKSNDAMRQLHNVPILVDFLRISGPHSNFSFPVSLFVTPSAFPPCLFSFPLLLLFLFILLTFIFVFIQITFGGALNI